MRHVNKGEYEHVPEGQVETVVRALDREGVPRADATGTSFSLWGRVQEYARQEVRAALPPAEPASEADALEWGAAPVRTQWGAGMMVTDVALDKDSTVTLYCHKDDAPKVSAVLAVGNQEFSAVHDVLAERQRQVEQEGHTVEHDDELGDESLALAASCYITAGPGDARPAAWPWDTNEWKPKDRRSNLVRAGALIIADIERLDRAKRVAKACVHKFRWQMGENRKRCELCGVAEDAGAAPDMQADLQRWTELLRILREAISGDTPE